MKQLDLEAIANTLTMSKADKLARWARLIREARSGLMIYHELEYWNPQQRKEPLANYSQAESAFTLAAKDPVFASMGLTSKPSLDDAMKFFELSRDEVHAFSCDCGGHLTNEQMARRVEALAAQSRIGRRSFL